MNQEILKSKKEIVAKIEDSLKDCASMTIVEYRGLTVAQISELKKLLKAAGSSFSVYKNTLFSRASDELGYKDLEQYLSGSNAYVFSKELNAGPKVLAKFAKTAEALEIKAGIVEGTLYDAKGMGTIASIPSREELLSKFAKKNENLVIKAGFAEGKVMDAEGMKAIATLPDKNGLLSMFLSCLNAPIQKFAATVKAVADSKN